MQRVLDIVTHWFATAQAQNALGTLLIAVFGLLIAKLSGRAVGRALAKRASAQQEMIIRRVTVYSLILLTTIAALRNAGFDLGMLIGAAGFLTIAAGFASKTAASNIISGLFLMGEKPFVVGDSVAVGGTTGEVVSIDLLSVKLRTFDNLLVRIPNESLLASELRNISHFPLRRLDLALQIDYAEDIPALREWLFFAADEEPLCLDSPEPQLMLLSFGESSISAQLSLWTARPNYVALRNAMVDRLSARYREAKIQAPYPHRRVHLDPASGARQSPGQSPDQILELR